MRSRVVEDTTPFRPLRTLLAVWKLTPAAMATSLRETGTSGSGGLGERSPGVLLTHIAPSVTNRQEQRGGDSRGNQAPMVPPVISGSRATSAIVLSVARTVSAHRSGPGPCGAGRCTPFLRHHANPSHKCSGEGR